MPDQTRQHCPELRELSVPPVIRPLRPGYRVARWDSPTALAPECRERLHLALRDLAARAFGADHSGYWRTRMASGFFDQISSLALILGPDGVPVGWGGYHRRSFASRRALYLDAAGVVPAHRRSGLSAALMTHFLNREVLAHPLTNTYVVLRTRHPAVYAGWRKGLGQARVFPRQDRPVPNLVRRIATDAADWLGDGPRLDPDTLTVRDAYRMFDGEIYGVTPRSGDPALDTRFAREVGPKDAVLVVARMSVLPLARVALGRLLGAQPHPAPRAGGRPVPGAVPENLTSRATPTGAGAAGLIPGGRL
ncbi:GNAT family N-acetyltransferase [Nocardiopsis valliformis]|uniref:GNAT family N-acetyltransferase n=1 Tax=Nocardiopsis valliformis TaxID=239974 RepID=UPI0003473F0B|nr:GNAT family N-acetyltransferase [Nocardiopsis valliformis]